MRIRQLDCIKFHEKFAKMRLHSSFPFIRWNVFLLQLHLSSKMNGLATIYRAVCVCVRVKNDEHSLIRAESYVQAELALVADDTCSML